MASSRSSSSSSAPIFLLGAAVGAAATTALIVFRRRSSNSKKPAPRRFGGAIQLKPSHFDLYTQLHDKPWPAVLERMSKSNMRNFTIYLHKETSTMFSHFEWIGHWKTPCSTPEEEQTLFSADMQAIAEDPITRAWWKLCEPCQQPFSQWKKGSKMLSDGGSGDWWAPLICINHCGHWSADYSADLRDPDFVAQNPKGETMEQPTNIVGK